MQEAQENQKQKQNNKICIAQSSFSTDHRTIQVNTRESQSCEHSLEVLNKVQLFLEKQKLHPQNQKQKENIEDNIGSSSTSYSQYNNQSIQASQEGQNSLQTYLEEQKLHQSNQKQKEKMQESARSSSNTNDSQQNQRNQSIQASEENKLKQKQDYNIQIITDFTSYSKSYAANTSILVSEERLKNNQKVYDQSDSISEIQYILSIDKSTNIGKLIEMVKNNQKSSNLDQLIEKVKYQQKYFYPRVNLQNKDANQTIAQLPLRSSFVDIVKNYDSIQLFITVSEENYLIHKQLQYFDPYSIYNLNLKLSNTIEKYGEKKEEQEFQKFEIKNYNKNKLIGRYITCDEEFVYLLNGFNYPDQNGKNNKKKFYNQCDKINIKDKSIEQIPGCKPIGYEHDHDVYIFTTKDNLFYAGVNQNENNIYNDDENKEILEDEPTKSIYEPTQFTQEYSYNNYQTKSAYNPEKESIRIELNLKMQIYDKENKIWYTVNTPMTDNKIFIFAAAKQKNQYYELIAKKKCQIKKFIINLVTIQQKDEDDEEEKDDNLISKREIYDEDEKIKIFKERLGILRIELINHEFILTNNNIPERIFISSIDPNHRIKEIKFLERPYFKKIHQYN